MIQGGVRTSPQSVAFPGGSRSSRRAPGGPVCPGGGAPWRRGFGGGGSGPRRGLSSLPGAAEVYGRNRGFGRLRGDPYVSPSPAGGRLSRRRGGGLYRPLAAGPLRPPPHDAEPPEALRLHPASFTSWGARTRLLSPPPTGPHTPNRREGVCRGTLPAGDRYMVASRHDPHNEANAYPREARARPPQTRGFAAISGPATAAPKYSHPPETPDPPAPRPRPPERSARDRPQAHAHHGERGGHAPDPSAPRRTRTP